MSGRRKEEEEERRRLRSSTTAVMRPSDMGALMGSGGGAGGGKPPRMPPPTPIPPFMPPVTPSKAPTRSPAQRQEQEAREAVMSMPRTPPRSRATTIDERGEVLQEVSQPPQPEPLPVLPTPRPPTAYESDEETGGYRMTDFGRQKMARDYYREAFDEERERLGQRGNIGYGFLPTPSSAPSTAPTQEPTKEPTKAPSRMPTLWGDELPSRYTQGGELRRLQEARGREGRIMRMKPKVGTAVKRQPAQQRRRLRKALVSQMMGYPDRPDRIPAFGDVGEVMIPANPGEPDILPMLPVGVDVPVTESDEEDRRRRRR